VSSASVLDERGYAMDMTRMKARETKPRKRVKPGKEDQATVDEFEREGMGGSAQGVRYV
jgi:hypothetical protein